MTLQNSVLGWEMPRDLVIRSVIDQGEMEAIYRLRVAAWRDRTSAFPRDLERWTDAFDASALHWAVWQGDRPVAAARLTIHDRLEESPNPEVFLPVLTSDIKGPIGVLTRLVVDITYAGMGLSRQLDEVRLTAAKSSGCRVVIGSTFAGQRRVAAMQALGFTLLGEAGPYANGPLATLAKGGGGQQSRRNAVDQRVIVGLRLDDPRP